MSRLWAVRLAASYRRRAQLSEQRYTRELDEAMEAAYRDGDSYPSIARAAGLSRQRVQQRLSPAERRTG